LRDEGAATGGSLIEFVKKCGVGFHQPDRSMEGIDRLFSTARNSDVVG
jgi:hypothetical protein